MDIDFYRMIKPTKPKLVGIILLLVLFNACTTNSSRNSTLAINSKPVDKSELVANAHLLLGAPYRYGGNRPTTGFDCSGFVQYTLSTVGVQVPRTTQGQHKISKLIDKQELEPGDLVFFRINRRRSISHVGIYIGKGRFIHAPSSGKRVSIAELNDPYWKRHYDSAGSLF